MNKFILYRWTLLALAPILRAYLKLRIRMGKEDSARIGERYGIAGIRRPQGRIIWIHAASVGETQSMLSVIERILNYYPDLHILMTTGTRTSAEFLSQRKVPRLIHQYIPLDHPKWVDAFLDHWQPSLGIWVESELWPNLIAQSKKRGMELILLNARMSDDSFKQWQRMPAFIDAVMKSFSLILAQTETYASYFRALGAPNVEMSGNLKFAAPPLPYNQNDFADLQSRVADRKIWVAASTHEGEEKAAAQLHKQLKPGFPALLTIIVPRHPNRAAKILEELRPLGLQISQRSARQPITPSTDIYLADTIGELGLFFALRPPVFMGNSLKTKGGHNLLEPARYGCPILHGPNMQNFVELSQLMQHYSATIIVPTELDLLANVNRLLTDRDAAQAIGLRAAQAAQSQDQILDWVFLRLQPFLGVPTGMEQQRNYANA